MVGALPPVVVKPATASLSPRPSSMMPPPPVILPPPIPKVVPKVVPKKKWLMIALVAVTPLMLGSVAYYFLVPKVEPLPVVTNPPPRVAPLPPPEPPLGQPLSSSQIAPLPPQPVMQQSSSASAKPAKATQSNSAAAMAFRAWLAEVRIVGVVAGDSPRAIVNGRLVRPGDVVDASQGIIFDGLDLERKEVVFRTNGGLFAGKAY